VYRGILERSFIDPDLSAAPKRRGHDAIILVSKSMKYRINSMNIEKLRNENE
jgi:hypothetical protein